MPAHSGFYAGDVRGLDWTTFPFLGCCHIVTMDPPWDSKSVVRSHSYAHVAHGDMGALLTAIPVPRLLTPGGVVAIWVTNNAAVQSLVLERILPAWGLMHVHTLVWLKMACNGQPVFPLSSQHRKPYELCVVAAQHMPPTYPKCDHREVPFTVVASLPIRHSAKPPIDDFLRNIMRAAGDKSEARAGGAAGVQLEVFARNLRRGWLSVGLEPLKHQELGPFMQAL